MTKKFTLFTIFFIFILTLLTIWFLFKNSNTIDNVKVACNPMNQILNLQDGLVVEKLNDCKGAREVKTGDYISIHYKGTLDDGTEFDSSYNRGTPFETQIGVGNVIQGWDLGVVGMKVGEKRKLTIPPLLGYSSRAQGKIPANSTLHFEVELMAIK